VSGCIVERQEIRRSISCLNRHNRFLISSAIQYLQHAPNDPVGRLQKDIDSGKIKLKYDPKRGYLPGDAISAAIGHFHGYVCQPQLTGMHKEDAWEADCDSG
jgi:hypothetical protein